MQSLHQHSVLISPAELASLEIVLTAVEEGSANQKVDQHWPLLKATETMASWIAAVQSTMLRTWLDLPADDPMRAAYAEEASHWARHGEALVSE